MASGAFLPGGFVFNVNAQYYTQPGYVAPLGAYTGDIAVDEIVSVVLTSQFPQINGTYLPAFQVVVVSKRTYEETTFYLTAYGLTLANFQAAILAYDAGAQFTLYTGLTAIDYNPANACDYANCLLNDREVANQRVYNPQKNQTNIFMYKKRHLAPQVWTVTGNATYNETPNYL